MRSENTLLVIKLSSFKPEPGLESPCQRHNESVHLRFRGLTRLSAFYSNRDVYSPYPSFSRSSLGIKRRAAEFMQ